MARSKSSGERKYLLKDPNYEFYYLESFLESLGLTEKDLIILGDFFLDIFLREPHKIYNKDFSEYISYGKRELTHLSFNEDFLREMASNIYMDPLAVPMICPPKPWSDKKYGGYLTNSITKDRFILGSKAHRHEMLNRKIVYKSVNYMSNVQFEINTNLLDYLLGEGKYLLTDKYHKNNDILQANRTLGIANALRNTPIYIPVKPDWRSRLYCDTFYLSYQGDELNSSIF